MIHFITYLVLFIIGSIEKIADFISGLFLGIVLISFISCNAQTNSKTLNKNRTEIQNQSNLPDFALPIAKNDKIEFENDFGFANRDMHLVSYSSRIIDNEKTYVHAENLGVKPNIALKNFKKNYRNRKILKLTKVNKNLIKKDNEYQPR